MTVGERIRFFREEAGLKAADLARAVGVSGPSIHFWERGVTTPRLDNLYRIAKACGIEVRLLIARDEEDGAA